MGGSPKPRKVGPRRVGPRRVGPRRVGLPKGGAPKGGGPEGWGPQGWGPEGWGPKGGGPNGGGPKGGGPEPRKSGARRVGARTVGPERWGPKISRFFFPLPPQFSFFSPSLLVFFVEFWWCLKRRDPQMCTFGVLGLSCASPGGPVWWGRRQVRSKFAFFHKPFESRAGSSERHPFVASDG